METENSKMQYIELEEPDFDEGIIETIQASEDTSYDMNPEVEP